MTRVFGIGLPRTGTNSLAIAGMQLGYKPIHTNVIAAEMLGMGIIPDIACLNRIDTHNFFSDEPYCTLWDWFFKNYPDSKFILTTRDYSSWERSIRYMFKHHVKNWPKNIKKFQLKYWNVNPEYWSGHHIPSQFLRQWYFNHHALVINSDISEDQLLILPLEAENKEDLLVQFLGKEISDLINYPNTNKGVYDEEKNINKGEYDKDEENTTT